MSMNSLVSEVPGHGTISCRSKEFSLSHSDQLWGPFSLQYGAWIVQSVKCLVMVQFPAEVKSFHYHIQTNFGVHPAFNTVGTRNRFLH